MRADCAALDVYHPSVIVEVHDGSYGFSGRRIVRRAVHFDVVLLRREVEPVDG